MIYCAQVNRFLFHANDFFLQESIVCVVPLTLLLTGPTSLIWNLFEHYVWHGLYLWKLQIAKITEDGMTISQPYALKTSWNLAAFQNPTAGAEGSW